MSNAFDVTVEALRNQGLNSDEILAELSKLFQNLADAISESAAEQTTVTKIRKTLQKLGMPVQLKGYNYWVDAIMLYIESDGMMKIGEIYTKIAEKCKSSYSNVGQSMRSAIEYVFEENGEDEVIKEMFVNNMSSSTGKPRNRQFLVVLAEQI